MLNVHGAETPVQDPGTAARDAATPVLTDGQGDPSDSGAQPPRDERQALADQLLEEITGWGPHDRAGAFRSWHRGALSLIHLNVLAVLEAEGPLPMNRLAEALDVSDASATGIVGRMEQRGLVERHHATDDRRIVLVHLTGGGSEVFHHLAARRRERLARLLAELTEEELSGFLAGLRAMRAARARLFAAAGTDAEPGTSDCAGER